MNIRLDLGSPEAWADLMEGLVTINRRDMRRGEVTTPLYDSPVVYRREHKTENWLTAKQVHERGQGDCEELVGIRVAELREWQGEADARPGVVQTGPTTWHMVVVRADDDIEDPTKILMRREGTMPEVEPTYMGPVTPAFAPEAYPAPGADLRLRWKIQKLARGRGWRGTVTVPLALRTLWEGPEGAEEGFEGVGQVIGQWVDYDPAGAAYGATQEAYEAALEEISRQAQAAEQRAYEAEAQLAQMAQQTARIEQVYGREFERFQRQAEREMMRQAREAERAMREQERGFQRMAREQEKAARLAQREQERTARLAQREQAREFRAALEAERQKFRERFMAERQRQREMRRPPPRRRRRPPYIPWMQPPGAPPPGAPPPAYAPPAPAAPMPTPAAPAPAMVGFLESVMPGLTPTPPTAPLPPPGPVPGTPPLAELPAIPPGAPGVPPDVAIALAALAEVLKAAQKPEVLTPLKTAARAVKKAVKKLKFWGWDPALDTTDAILGFVEVL